MGVSLGSATVGGSVIGRYLLQLRGPALRLGFVPVGSEHISLVVLASLGAYRGPAKAKALLANAAH